MDPRNTIVSKSRSRTAVSRPSAVEDSARLGPCTKTIDLRGRTAVPGLIDNHNHIVLLGIRPAHDTRLETSASIADVQAALRARAKDGARRPVHHRHGRLEPAQFVEKRLPTLAELDAAAPDHPVLVFQAFTGPAATNTRGRRSLAGKASRSAMRA
jgi:predicted amidohydrolase YtcJ